MSILTEPLPISVCLTDREVPVQWDYRVMLRIDELLTAAMPEESRGVEILALFYGEIPECLEEATAAMLWFFLCGKEPPAETQGAADGETKPLQPDFSYQQDAGLIYAAFLSQYNLDLAEERLHWWAFRALFDGLWGDHLFCEVRRCRSIRITKDMGKDQKRYYRAMKKLYALPVPEEEKREQDQLTAALLGDGNVMGVLYDDEED